MTSDNDTNYGLLQKITPFEFKKVNDQIIWKNEKSGNKEAFLKFTYIN
jgi:hypothetical protein